MNKEAEDDEDEDDEGPMDDVYLPPPTAMDQVSSSRVPIVMPGRIGTF